MQNRHATQGTTLQAETATLTAVRSESSDPDRGPLAETHTLTEVRQETSDPDRGAVAETETITKANGETSDADQTAFAGAVEWIPGDRRPLLFKDAVRVTAPPTTMGYCDRLDMAVDDLGRPIIDLGVALGTATETATLDETTDSDQR